VSCSSGCACGPCVRGVRKYRRTAALERRPELGRLRGRRLGNLSADFQGALQARANSLGAQGAAELKTQTGVDVTQARVASGASAALSLSQSGYDPSSSGDNQKLVAAIAGGACLIPGVGPLIGGAVEGLYQAGMAIACPTEQFFASVGLSTLPPQCGGAPCKTTGNWSAAGILSQNARQLPSSSKGSFGQFVLGALAAFAAQAANCKGPVLPPGVIVDAAVAIWNKTHAGPVAPVLVPPLYTVNKGLTAYGPPTLIAAWSSVSGSSGPAARAGKDPYAFYAFLPTGTTAPDHPAGSPSSSDAWTPWKVAPAPAGMNVDPPRVVRVNMGPALPPPAPPPKILQFHLGPVPAHIAPAPPPALRPRASSSGAVVAVAAVGVAGVLGVLAVKSGAVVLPRALARLFR
jgi:hypothetical protein